MASTTSKPPSKPVQALIVYNRYCWCADEVCVIVLSLRYYYMHFLQSCQDGVLLFSVLKSSSEGTHLGNVYYSLAGATLQRTNRKLRLMRSGEPSRISLRKRWISLTLRARLKWLAGVIHIAQMLCTGWDLLVSKNF